jgi:8-oxo-dGTP pyrophosphatase MutT (NUDIX family)
MHGNQVWSLPKGLVEEHESPEEAALREVEEETGLRGRVVGKVADSTYWYVVPSEGVRYKKTVHFYLMEYLSGDSSAHDWEVDEVRWVSPEEAMSLLSYQGEREVLSRALGMLLGRQP